MRTKINDFTQDVKRENPCRALKIILKAAEKQAPVHAAFKEPRVDYVAPILFKRRTGWKDFPPGKKVLTSPSDSSTFELIVPPLEALARLPGDPVRLQRRTGYNHTDHWQVLKYMSGKGPVVPRPQKAGNG